MLSIRKLGSRPKLIFFYPEGGTLPEPLPHILMPTHGCIRIGVLLNWALVAGYQESSLLSMEQAR